MIRIQTPPGCSEASHAGQPFPIDPSTGQIEVPDDVAPFFLRLEGFREVPEPAATPTTNRTSNRRAATEPATQED